MVEIRSIHLSERGPRSQQYDTNDMIYVVVLVNDYCFESRISQTYSPKHFICNFFSIQCTPYFCIRKTICWNAISILHICKLERLYRIMGFTSQNVPFLISNQTVSSLFIAAMDHYMSVSSNSIDQNLDCEPINILRQVQITDMLVVYIFHIWCTMILFYMR